MKRTIEYSPKYKRKVRKLANRNPQLRGPYTEMLPCLSEDPFDPRLYTHGLTGRLSGKYACSLTHELRAIFTLSDDTVRLLLI